MTELSENQKIVMEVRKREYDVKFKTWAIDRAIEIMKFGEKEKANAATVIENADMLCAWVTKSPKEFAVPSEDEAALVVQDMKNHGELPEAAE